MYQIRMEYNPYKQEIAYQFHGSAGWESVSYESGLLVDKFQKTALQTSVDEILKQIIMKYATNAEHSVGIVFCGTDEDYADLTDAIQRNPKVMNGAVKVVAEKDKESFYQPASVVAEKIDNIFSGLENEFSQLQDEEVKVILRQYDDASSSTIPLCVMGLYSSGKSMFINALIGEEILPSASDPLTAQIFKVTPGTNYQVAFSCENTELHFEIIEQTARLLNREDCSQCSAWIKEMTGISGTTNAEIMRQIISKLNDSDKLSDKLKSEGLTSVNGLISIEVPFRNSTLPTGKIHFEIYDTPGLNSESHKEHTKVLQAALEDRTNGLPILITTRKTLDLTGIQNLMDELNCKGVKLDRENLMILINQADQEGPNTLKKFHDDPTEAAVTIQKNSSIMFLSSLIALGCKCKGTGYAEWSDSDCEMIYERNRADFESPQNKYYKVFPQYGILPPSRYEKICQQAQKAEDTVTSGDTSEDAIRELIAQNSGIRAVESEITYYAQRFADYNKCQMASGYLKEAIQKVSEKIKVEQDRQAAIETELSNEREQKKNELVNDISRSGKYAVTRAEHEFNEKLLKLDLKKNVLRHEAVEKAKELCMLHKKDKDQYKRLEKDIENIIWQKLEAYHNYILGLSQGHWKAKESELKEQLIRIVNDNQNISDEERNILDQKIRGYAAIPIAPVSFDARKITKDKKFLIIPIGKKLDIEKCKDEVERLFINKQSDVITTLQRAHKSTFEQWSDKMVRDLTERLDDFNDDLRILNTELSRSRTKIEELQAQQHKLDSAKESIQDMLSCQEVTA